jgi:glycosyltransferase involved in cell wall biosynthesis
VAPSDPPTRLLAVCGVSQPGGAEIGLLRLLTRLDPQRWSITLTSPGEGALKEAAGRHGWRWERLDPGALAGGPRSAARALLEWPRTRTLARHADVVYLNGVTCGRLLGALRHRRTVLHVHDMVSRTPHHWRRAAIVLADSQAVADRLRGLASHVVHCPVELAPPAASAPWPSDGRPVVGFVGRIEPRKGTLDLVSAAAAIRIGEPSCRIVIVGGDPYGSDPDYLARVRAATEVEHYPWAQDAPGLMRHIDVLVAPSRQEPFGTVAAEAMAVGTPVVASAVDGLPEVVQDGISGILIEPGSPDQLAQAVLDVLARREEMGRAATTAARRFDADDYAHRVEALIAPPR